MQKRNRLVVGRRESETVIIYPERGLPIEIQLSAVRCGQARLSIVAEPSVRIMRRELLDDGGPDSP